MSSQCYANLSSNIPGLIVFLFCLEQRTKLHSQNKIGHQQKENRYRHKKVFSSADKSLSVAVLETSMMVYIYLYNVPSLFPTSRIKLL